MKNVTDITGLEKKTAVELLRELVAALQEDRVEFVMDALDLPELSREHIQFGSAAYERIIQQLESLLEKHS